MDTYSSVAKRKKRKTRKCLDEIRKRSRRNGNDTLFEQSPLNIENKVTNCNGMKPNICITSNRLTLAMFPKVIKSETITRPILSEIIEDPVINYENIIKNKKSTNIAPSSSNKLHEASHSDSDYIKYSEDNTISSTCERLSAVGSMSIQKDSDSRNLSPQDNNSAGSFLLFSPTDQREDSELFEVSPETLSTSSSSHSSQGSYRYQLYEEFMNEIPVYLKQNTPALIKDDAMKRTKSLLHELYLDSCRRESEENILHSMRRSFVRKKCYNISKETVVQSPVTDYLRINHLSRPRADPDRQTILYDNDKPDCQSMYDSVNPDHHIMYDSDKDIRRTMYNSDKSDHHTIYNGSDRHISCDRSGHPKIYDRSDRPTIYDRSGHHKIYDRSDRPTIYNRSDRPTIYNRSHDKPDCHTMYNTPDYTYYPHKLNQ